MGSCGHIGISLYILKILQVFHIFRNFQISSRFCRFQIFQKFAVSCTLVLATFPLHSVKQPCIWKVWCSNDFINIRQQQNRAGMQVVHQKIRFWPFKIMIFGHLQVDTTISVSVSERPVGKWPMPIICATHCRRYCGLFEFRYRQTQANNRNAQ